MLQPRSTAASRRSSARDPLALAVDPLALAVDPLALALDPGTPPDTLGRLARTRNRSVLRAVAMHPRVPLDVALRLGFRFPEILVKHPAFLQAIERPEGLAAVPAPTARSVLRVPLLPPAVCERLAHHPSAEVRRAAVGAPIIPPPLRRSKRPPPRPRIPRRAAPRMTAWVALAVRAREHAPPVAPRLSARAKRRRRSSPRPSRAEDPRPAATIAVAVEIAERADVGPGARGGATLRQGHARRGATRDTARAT